MIDFSSYFAPVTQRLDAMEKRERLMVITASIVVVFTLFYALAWEPVFAEREAQQQRYQSQGQMLIWMKDSGQQIKTLTSSGASSSARFKNQSTSSLIDRSAQSMGVKSFIKKQSSDKKGVKIELEQASFDRVIAWLHDMQKIYGITTSSIKIEKQDKPGSVDVRVTLERVNK